MLRKHHEFRQEDEVRNSDVFLLQFLTPCYATTIQTLVSLGYLWFHFSRGGTTVVERLISEERTPEFVSRDRINTRGLLKITEKCKKLDLRLART